MPLQGEKYTLCKDDRGKGDEKRGEKYLGPCRKGFGFETRAGSIPQEQDRVMHERGDPLSDTPDRREGAVTLVGVSGFWMDLIDEDHLWTGMVELHGGGAYYRDVTVDVANCHVDP